MLPYDADHPQSNGRPGSDPLPEGSIRTTVVIRPPTPLDLPAMADLWVAMQEEFKEEEPRYPGPGGEHPRDEYLERLETWFHEPAFMLVGVRGSEPAPLPEGTMPDPGQSLGMTSDELFGRGALPPMGEVVAYTVMRATDAHGDAGGPIGRLEALYVQPSLRRNGLARRMLEAGCGWLRAQHIDEVDAHILVRNRTGMIFLSRAGFQLFRSVLRVSLEDGLFPE